MMENENRKAGSFIAYEYKEVSADSGQISFLIDGYENFGWEVDENIIQYGMEKYPEKAGASPHRKAVLRLKRNRKIINKMELTRLQRNFEACVAEIGNLEKEKTSRPAVQALSLGIIPGFLGWIFPYFLYKRGVRKQTEKITPLIEEKYDEIYEICEKGNKLLN